MSLSKTQHFSITPHIFKIKVHIWNFKIIKNYHIFLKYFEILTTILCFNRFKTQKYDYFRQHLYILMIPLSFLCRNVNWGKLWKKVVIIILKVQYLASLPPLEPGTQAIKSSRKDCSLLWICSGKFPSSASNIVGEWERANPFPRMPEWVLHTCWVKENIYFKIQNFKYLNFLTC